jgi:hypothetical protein
MSCRGHSIIMKCFGGGGGKGLSGVTVYDRVRRG